MTAPEACARRSYYPALFVLYPALFLFAHNIEETAFEAILLPLAMTAAVAGLIGLVARLTVRERGKASLLTFIALFTIFSYGHAINLLSKIPGFAARVPAGASIAVWIGAAGFLGFLVVRARNPFSGLISFLNVFVAILVALSLAQVASFYLRPLFAPRPGDPAAVSLNLAGAVPRREGGLPDIYYLIFDRYASESTLRAYYDFDNDEFLAYLKDKGFYVASNSRCNYPGTYLSLSSSLNMEYLDFLVKTGPVKKSVINRMLQDYKVWRLLRSAGYRFIHFGDWYEPTKYNRNADLNYRSGGMIDLSRDFTRKFLESTLAGSLVRDTIISATTRERILEKFARLAEIPGTAGPKFVFAHILLPHHPFLFGPNGENVLKGSASVRPQELKYVDQLRFTNAKIRELIDAILARSDRDPIIIIQSDEGPGEEEKPLDLIRRYTQAADRYALNTRIRCRILNAYRFPGVGRGAFYPRISPVNSFRLLFDRYFGTNFGLLPDKTYRSSGDKTTVRAFKPVPDKVWTRQLRKTDE
jgi:hypothetical protein